MSDLAGDAAGFAFDLSSVEVVCAGATPAINSRPSTTSETSRNRFIVLLFMTFILDSNEFGLVASNRLPEMAADNRPPPKFALTEEHRTRARAVNLHVTRYAVGVLRILVVLWAGRFNRAHVVRDAVARQAKLIDGAVAQQPRIS